MPFRTPQVSAFKVKVSSSDHLAEYLDQKLVEGSGITITKVTDGDGVETLQFSSAAGGGVSVADISAQFNGILTTFTIPAYASIYLFVITGWFPNGALEPTVDFTTPTATTVHITGDLTAPEAGTRGIILYEPA